MTRYLQVRLEDGDYEEFTRKADERGLSLQDAGRKAVFKWMGDKPSSPLDALAKQDESALLALLEIRRDQTNPYRELLDFVLARGKPVKRGARPR